jgi:hypothetical protein
MGAAADPTRTNGVTAWHAMSANDVVKSLGTDCEKSRDPAEAARRLQAYRPNRLPEGKRQGPFMRFLSQLNKVLISGCKVRRTSESPSGGGFRAPLSDFTSFEES